MNAMAEIDDRIEKCQKILDSDPNSQIFAALAEACRKKGELDRAFRVCQNGLKIHQNYGSAHVVMAKINLDRGLYDWAEAEVQKAIDLAGPSRATDLLLAEIHIYKGEFAAAVKLLKNLHQNDPDNKQIKRLLDIACKIPEEQKSTMYQNNAAEEETFILSSSGEEMPPEEPSKVELGAQEIVKQAIEIQGIDGAVFVTVDGMIGHSEWSLDMDPEICGVAMSDVSNHVSHELMQNSFGDVSSVLIETQGLTFKLMKSSKGTFVFVGSESMNLGTMRMTISDLLERFED